MARVSFKKDDFSKGGFEIPDGEYTIDEAKFIKHEWKEDAAKGIKARTDVQLLLTLINSAGEALPEKGLKVGEAERYEIALSEDDGETGGSIEGPAPSEKGAFAQFMQSLEEAGFDMTRLESDETDSEGAPYFDVRKLAGVTVELATEAVPFGKSAGKLGKRPEDTYGVLKVRKLIDEAPKKGAKKTAAANSKAPMGVDGVKSRPKEGKEKKETGPSVEKLAADYLVRVMADNGGTLARAKVSLKVNMAAKNEKNKAEIVTMASDAEFQESGGDGLWELDGDKIELTEAGSERADELKTE